MTLFRAEPPDVEGAPPVTEPARPIVDPSEHLSLLLRRFEGRLERYRWTRSREPEAAGRIASLDRRLAEFDRELAARMAVSDPLLLPIARLAHGFGLDALALELLVGAAAPGLDLELGRTVAELGDGQRMGDVGTLLGVLADDAAEVHRLLAELSEGAPLVRYRLVRTGAARGWGADGPLLLAPISVPERVLGWMRGDTHFTGLRFERSTRLVCDAGPAWLAPELSALLDRVIFRLGDAAEEPGGYARLPTVLAGPSLSGKRTAAIAAARVRGMTVVDADLARVALAADPVDVLRDIVREACLHDAVLLLRHADAVLDEKRAAFRDAIRAAMTDGRVWVVLTTSGEPGELVRLAPGTQLVRLDLPDEAQQLRLWERALPPEAPVDLPAIVQRYQLTPGDIAEAATAALGEADRRGTALELAHVVEAVRGRLRHRLGDVADVVVTTAEWDDVVVQGDIVDRIHELLSVVRANRLVMDEWGFGRRFNYGRGLSALFSGPPGTGKTMIAGLIAKELGLELFRVDLSRVVSKWLGETEKNLGRAFDEARNGRAILMFDEADALFGKRTEVKSSNDRYANLETNYLLQRIETFEGIVLLTTNRETSIDEAFRRRLRFRIEFRTPEVDERELLWRSMIPPSAPLAHGVDFRKLAERFAMTGGYIKNAALRAAFFATSSPARMISQDLLEKAAALEWEEMGKL